MGAGSTNPPTLDARVLFHVGFFVRIGFILEEERIA